MYMSGGKRGRAAPRPIPRRDIEACFGMAGVVREFKRSLVFFLVKFYDLAIRNNNGDGDGELNPCWMRSAVVFVDSRCQDFSFSHADNIR